MSSCRIRAVFVFALCNVFFRTTGKTFATMPAQHSTHHDFCCAVGACSVCFVFFFIVKWKQTEPFSLELHCLCTYSLGGFLLPDFIHKLHLFLFIVITCCFLSVSLVVRATGLIVIILKTNIYILNVKLGMPVFYSFKVVSYLLVLKLKRWASLFKVQTWINLCLGCRSHQQKLVQVCIFQ